MGGTKQQGLGVNEPGKVANQGVMLGKCVMGGKVTWGNVVVRVRRCVNPTGGRTNVKGNVNSTVMNQKVTLNK